MEMNRTITIHEKDGIRIAEIISEDKLFQSAPDGLQLLMDHYYQDFDRIIIHEKNINSAFFDLKTGLAGEILQKFSNYRVRLSIVGDFTGYPGKSIRDFIFESNKQGRITFVDTLEMAKERLFK
jgi:hypothetical protein